jgi:TolA-binding protein
MTSQRFEPEDLVALDRRGQLDNEQADHLERLYREDPRTAELYRLGRAFDEEDLVQPGDELLVSRSVEGALRVRSSSKRQKKPRAHAWWLLAAVLAGSSAAAAGIAGFVGLPGVQTPAPSSAATVAALEPSSAKTVRARSGASKHEHASAVASNELANPSLPAAAGSSDDLSDWLWTAPRREAIGAARRERELATAREAAPAEGPRDAITPTRATQSHALAAADLFRAANEARRQGDASLCIRRYRDLQQRFAASPEAQESHVSLGKVLQSSGDVAGAAREFSVYLRRPGALEEESLVGLAEALAQLGSSAQARSTWQRLLDRYPSSVYAVRARKRLAELE